MENQNPITAFLLWYSSLPSHHRREIALLSQWYLPALGPTNETAERNFLAYVASHESVKFKAVGMAITLHHILDFAIPQLNTHDTNVEYQQGNLRELKAKVEADGLDAAWVEDLIRTRPLEAERWKKTSESWSSFKNNNFDLVRLDQFQRSS